MHFKSVSSCLVISLKEAGWAHLKSKLLTVITKVSGGKVSQRQLLNSLSLHLQDSSVWNRWSRLEWGRKERRDWGRWMGRGRKGEMKEWRDRGRGKEGERGWEEGKRLISKMSSKCLCTCAKNQTCNWYFNKMYGDTNASMKTNHMTYKFPSKPRHLPRLWWNFESSLVVFLPTWHPS